MNGKVTQSIKMMGTTIDLTVFHLEGARILDRAINYLHEFNIRFSANDSTSELSMINQQAGIQPVHVHEQLFELIEWGKYHSLSSPSDLNIAIGPLIKTWRVGFKDARVPSTAEVSSVLSLINPENIILNHEAKTVFLSEKGMEIDLGALAKGYIADKIKAYFIEEGVASAFINLGGNVLTLGGAPHQFDQKWRIGIQNPQLPRGSHVMVLKIENQSVVTSGIYERVLKTSDGKEYHHIFDQHTGYPMETEIASLTIVSKKSVDGEIWTTRLFGQSVETILETVQQLPEIECIVITRQNRIYYSLGISPMIDS